MFNVILFQPEIPPNTGNVIRLCANTGAHLHLIRPLGFELEDRQLRRAGLDYHEYAAMQVHDSLAQCLQTLPIATTPPHPNPSPRPLSSFAPRPTQAGERAKEKSNFESPEEGTDVSLRELLNTRRVFALTTKATRSFYDARFQAGDAFLFGPESRGLPHDVLEALPKERRLRLPMLPHNRSLNLSNTVAVAVFEAWRQCEFLSAG